MSDDFNVLNEEVCRGIACGDQWIWPNRPAGISRPGRAAHRILTSWRSTTCRTPSTWRLLLKYDSVQGRFKGTVSAREQSIVVNGKEIPITTEKDPAALPWKKLGCQVALESTGRFTDRASLQKHIDAGAERVILSAPAKDDLDATIVLGVNDKILNKNHRIISNASCTTNCLAPLAKVLARDVRDRERLDDDGARLHQRPARRRPGPRGPVSCPRGRGEHHSVQDRGGQGRRRGHPRTEGQADRLRAPRARARRLGRRPDRPLEDQRAPATRSTAAIKAAAEGPLKGILEYATDPLVSSDIIGNPHSSIFVPEQTLTIGGNFIKVVSWYDNEWGYSNRTAELMTKLGSL